MYIIIILLDTELKAKTENFDVLQINLTYIFLKLQSDIIIEIFIVKNCTETIF